MSEPTGYRESPDTADGPAPGNMVDGVPGEDRSDGGERDEAALTTDDDAQREESATRPGNTSD
jgi:hypothetical protein